MPEHNLVRMPLPLFVLLGIILIGILLFRFIKNTSELGSIESTYFTIMMTFNRLIHENPDYLLKGNIDKLARALIKSRWSVRKYDDDIIRLINESNDKDKLHALFYWMMIYEYNPPLSYKLTSEQEEELSLKILSLLQKTLNKAV